MNSLRGILISFLMVLIPSLGFVSYRSSERDEDGGARIQLASWNANAGSGGGISIIDPPRIRDSADILLKLDEALKNSESTQKQLEKMEGLIRTVSDSTLSSSRNDGDSDAKYKMMLDEIDSRIERSFAKYVNNVGKCDCDCPNADQIAIAVIERLKKSGYLSQSSVSGSTPSTGSSSSNGIRLAPGEVLTAVDGVPVNQVYQSSSSPAYYSSSYGNYQSGFQGSSIGSGTGPYRTPVRSYLFRGGVVSGGNCANGQCGR